MFFPILDGFCFPILDVFFAIQDGGQCFSSETAHQTYDKYGTSTECLPDGEGGPMANQVYKIKIGKGISK